MSKMLRLDGTPCVIVEHFEITQVFDIIEHLAPQLVDENSGHFAAMIQQSVEEPDLFLLLSVDAQQGDSETDHPSPDEHSGDVRIDRPETYYSTPVADDTIKNADARPPGFEHVREKISDVTEHRV